MSLRPLSLLLVACGLLFAAGCARETPAEHAANVYAAQELAASPPHGNLPDYSLPPADLVKAQHLSTIYETLHVTDRAWELLSLLLLLGFGAIAWMRDTAVKVSTNRWAQGYLFLLLFLLATTVLTLPLDLYGHQLSLKYGLSVQGWPSWNLLLLSLGVVGTGQFLEGNILSPKLVGASVGLHPVWLIFALLAFGTLFGFTGLIIAVPVAAAIGVVLRFATARYLESPLYVGRVGATSTPILLDVSAADRDRS